MSKSRVCDMCKRVEPDVDCKYTTSTRTWFERTWDSQGGSDRRLDICDQCWETIRKFIKGELK